MSEQDDAFEALLREVAAAPDIALPEPVAPLEIGLLIADRYRVIEEIGRGAMGCVYRVSDEDLGEEIALKLLHPSLGVEKQALRSEVRLARRVSHPNVCRVHDLGVDGERSFVTMELLRGESLRALVPRDALTLGQRIDLLVQIASGLAAAHRSGVIHGDVKPDNVVVLGSRAVLTDFGVARLSLSAPTIVAGTPAYMAPELLLGQPADRRIDTYAFAVLALELLSGLRPRHVVTIAEARQLASEPIEISALPGTLASREVLAGIEQVLSRALSIDPSVRPDPIDRLAALLARAASGVSPASVVTAAAPERTATALVARFAEAPSRQNDGIDERLERVVTDLGGLITRVSGERLEALFGAPRSRGDDAIRAARAALELSALDSSASIAVHTGRVTLHDSKTADGAALERARELAKKRGARCSRETRGQLAAHYAVELATADGGCLLGERPDDAPGALTRLIGREGLLAELEAHVLGALTNRRASVVRVRGPAGIGKSRLVEELLDRMIAQRDLEVISARAAPYAASNVLAALRASLGAEGEEPLRVALLARAAQHPLLVLVDDVQWADGESQAALATVEGLLEDAGLVVLLVARDDAELWPEGPATTTLDVGPLDAAAAQALVVGTAPVAAVDAVQRALTFAGGNPFVLEELGRTLRAGHDRLPQSVVAAAQEQLDRLEDDSRSLALCASIFDGDFLLSELESVAPKGLGGAVGEPLSALVVAQVLVATPVADGIRHRFCSALVRDVARETLGVARRERLHGVVARLLADSGGDGHANQRRVASHWERAGNLEHARTAFRSAGIGALAESAIAPASDALLALERLTPEAERDVALDVLVGTALSSRDGVGAEQRLRRAFAATEQTDPRRPEIALKLGRLAGARSESNVAIGWYRQGLETLDQLPEDQVTVRAALLANLGGQLGYEGDDNTTGLPLSEQAVALLEGTTHRRELAAALSRLGGNYMRAGRYRDQRRCNERNLSIAIELGDQLAELTGRINLGVVLLSLGDVDTAIEHTLAALSICAAVGDSRARAVALSNLGLLRIETGDLDDAREQIERAIEIGTQVGYDRFFYEAYAALSRIHFLSGSAELAEASARTAVGVALAASSEVCEGITLRFLAAARAAQGATDEALAHLERAHQCLRGRDECEDARAMVVEARVLDARGECEQANVLRAQARSVFERLGARLDLANVESLVASDADGVGRFGDLR